MRVALVQMSMFRDKTKNVEAALRLVQDAVEGGAQVVCLPELFNTIFFPFEVSDAHFDLAEGVDGATVTALREAARALSVTVVAPFFERASRGVYFNSAAVIDPTGRVAGLYRKTHIPAVASPSLWAMEKYYFTPGDLGFPVFTTESGLTLGLLICYDRHFPEAARCLSLSGADVILVPTATGGFTEDVWTMELQAIAVANGVYVGAANRVGMDTDGAPYSFYGRSPWIAPDGSVVAEGSGQGADIVYGDVSLEHLERVRRLWPFRRDRRPDAYGGLASVDKSPVIPEL